MTSYSTRDEFLERELHSLVIDTALYDWDEVWRYPYATPKSLGPERK